MSAASPEQLVSSRTHLRTPMETTAFALLTVGSALVPFVAWTVGVGLTWGSRRFVLREELAATLVLPGGLLAGFLWGGWMAGLTQFSCSSGGSGRTAGLAGPVIGGSVSTSPTVCTSPTIPGWLGALSLVLGLAASVAGPIWAWRRMRARERA
jgi:hypothetical protein